MRMFLLKATYAALRSLRPETRPFILARGGYAGLQRYAALWTGDNASSWDFLRITIPQVLNLGLSGVPISGSDVGGFATGPIPDGTTAPSVVRDGRVIGGVTDPELFVRWMQAGSFLPWFRNHYIGYDKEYQEVYAYGEAVAGICRAAIERRYRMLQVYYDAMYEWTQTGMPIVRALFLNDPDDPAVYRAPGRPVLRRQGPPGRADPGAGGRGRRRRRCATSICRPAATGSSSREGRSAGRAADGRPDAVGSSKWRSTRCRCSCAPVRSCRCARAPSSTSANWRRTRWRSASIPARTTQHLLYQDDGISTRAERDGAFRTTRISRTAVPGGTSLRLQRLHDGYTPAEAFFFIRWLGMTRAVGGERRRARRGRRFIARGSRRGPGDAYVWDEDAAEVIVKVFDRAPDVTIVVQVASPAPDARAEVSAMIERLWLGKPAEISFTCDFHELVAGDLRPGAATPAALRSAPHRPAGRALSLR